MGFDRSFGTRKSLNKRTNHGTVISGQGSILFDKDENQRLFEALGSQFVCIAAGFAYLYCLQDSTWHRIRLGVCALAKDQKTNQCVLKFFNFLFVEQWSQVVSRNFEISMSPDFWRFQVGNKWYAMRFVSSTEAVVMSSILNQHGADSPTTTVPPERSTSLDQQNRTRSRSIETSNSVQNGRDKSLERQAKTRRSIRKLNKKDIGQPFDVRHVTHAGSEKFDELKSIITSANDLTKNNQNLHNTCQPETSKSVSPRLPPKCILPPKRPPPPVPISSPILSPTAPPLTPPSSPLNVSIFNERPPSISKSKSLDSPGETLKFGENELEFDGEYAVIMKKADGGEKSAKQVVPDSSGDLHAKKDFDLIGKDLDSMSREELAQMDELLRSKLQAFEQRQQDQPEASNDEATASLYPNLCDGQPPKLPTGLYPKLSAVQDPSGNDPKSSGQSLQSPTGSPPKLPAGRSPTPFTQQNFQLPAEQNLQHLNKQRPKRPPLPNLQNLTKKVSPASQAQNQRPVPPPRITSPTKTPSKMLPKQVSNTVELFENLSNQQK